MNSRLASRLLLFVGGVLLLVSLVQPALAQSGDVGCGGTGQVACSGSVSFSTDSDSGSGQIAFTGLSGISSNFLAANPNLADDLQGELLNFSFTTGGFLLSSGDGDFQLKADVVGNQIGANSLTITLLFTDVQVDLGTGGACSDDSCANTDVSLNGDNIRGSLTINFTGDPTITSASGTFGLPFSSGPAPTPEPGTLLLLGSGLAGLGFIRRKFAQG